MHGRMDAAEPDSAFMGKRGSAISARPMPMRSAAPLSRIRSAWAGVVIRPATMTGSVVVALMAAACRTATPNGTVWSFT